MSGLAVCLMLLSTTLGILGNCPEVQPPQWGSVRKFILKDGTLQIVYSCESSRRVKGHRVATCIGDRWDHSIPKCVPRESQNRNDHFLAHLFPGDQPIIPYEDEQQTARNPLKTVERIDKLKNHRKTKESKKKKKKRRKLAHGKSLSKLPAATRLNETVVSQLDISCFAKTLGKGPIKAPLIEHTTPAKYARRKNILPPYNRYLVAVYECKDSYVFVDSTTDRLFCSNGTWLGPRPKCVKENQPPIDKVKRCDQDTRECDQVCEDIPTGIKCSCFDGFRAKGSSCIDIDECVEGTAKCTDICVNKFGSYSCECHHGFQLAVDGHFCEDVNECLWNNGHGPCQGTCHNFEGSYKCSCADLSGYKLAADNHTCQDIDECALDNANCSHLCLNTPGSVFCLCPDGFYLTENWKTCQDINECEVTPQVCEKNTECENTVGSYKCISKMHPETKIFREKDYDSEDDDEDDDGDYGEEITESQQNLRCEDGFKRNENFECVDINECIENKSHGCQHECVNEPGGYHCACRTGYELEEDGTTCKDVNECNKPSRPCSHICHNTDGTYVCACPPGLILTDDNATCAEDCTFLADLCSHACENTENGPRCSCLKGYRILQDARTCIDVDECAEDSHGCSHDCANLVGSYKCECPDNMFLDDTGRNCIPSDVCEAANCSQICEKDRNTYRCICQKGYILQKDERTCQDIDECFDDEHDCSHDCRNLEGSYLCFCPTGFELEEDNRTCIAKDECAKEDNNCTCLAGYNYSQEERVCIDIDECRDDHNCSHNCINTNGSYYCECPSGWHLQEDSRICQPSNDFCAENYGCSHMCEQNDDQIRCSCPKGYKLHDDERTCEDVDECAKPDNPCSHSCVNQNDTFECVCPTGYRISEDGRTCEDINECIEDNGGCSHLCANTEGGVECACPDNYKLLKDDGKTCVEINACSIDNGGCSHFCQHENGRASCFCPPEMILTEDEIECMYENECLNEDNGGCSHLCSYEDGNVTCACPSGMILSEDQRLCECPDGYRLSPQNNITCVDIDECLELRDNCTHRCLNTPGGFDCSCNAGFSRNPRDSAFCDDIDECETENAGCSHTCTNLVGSFECLCPIGYALERNNRTCVLVDGCKRDNGNCSHHCHQEKSADGDPGIRCSCPLGFRLRRDRRTCEDIDECEEFENDVDSGCSHTCVNTEGGYHCECPSGYILMPDDKRNCVDVDECLTSRHNCSHDCVNLLGNYVCACYEGHYLHSDKSTCLDIDECRENNGECSHTCTNTIGGHFCSCPTGYELTQDEKTCVDIDECAFANGGCAERCVNVAGDYRCECSPGYQLASNRKSCDDVDECENNGICSHAWCVNTVGSFRCECPLDYKFWNGSCRPSDPCLDRNGGCEQTCVAENGTAVCSCKEGFREDEVDRTKCHDIDECEGQHNCDHICVNNPGSYECRCKEGFQMVNSTCVDVDECAAGVCKGNKCTNVPGGYRCECEAGYRFQGDTCVDIDECIEKAPCSERCVNTPGSYYCTCLPGFQLQGDECVDINECEQHHDRCDQECINTVGSFTCACRAGYALISREQCQDVNECLSRNGGCTGECINTAGSYYCACSEDLVLAPDERTCISPTSRCRAMEPPLHGEIRCPGHPSGASVYPQGAKCHVRCRRGFRLEGAHMRHCVSGGRWNGREPICLREVVTDSLYNPNTPRPFVSCPQDMDVELPARQNTIRVTFPQPKSNMNWWRYVHASPPWAKQLQADLPAGTTIVTFTAWSPVSNYTSTCRIVIRVRDTENPKVTMCPTSFEVRLSPGERNRLIFWQEPTFTDNVGVEHVYKTRGPGHVMYPGVHNVRYIASDAAGNRAECHFSIHVRESEDRLNSEPRFYRRKMLMCPGRPPQPVRSSSYSWQIPSGCYLRYTRIFSGAYQRHPEYRQNGYQDAGTSYHELPPIQQTRSRPGIGRMYNIDDCLDCVEDVDKPLKAFTKRTISSSRRHRVNQSLVMRYPASIVADSTSSLCSSLHQESNLKINPTLQSSLQSILKSPSRHEDRTEGKIGDHGPKRRKRPSLRRSLSFADSEHPIIDISNLDYKAYRHKLIEATLRKQYDDFQPPGNVVLNSLHLNSADSVIGVRLNDRYDHSLFDFVEEYYDATKATNRKKNERLHPLDHFLTKGMRKPRTIEKETITNENIDWKSLDREDMKNYSPEVINNNFSKLSGMDNNGNPCVHSPAQILSFGDNASAIVKSDSDSKLEVPNEHMTQSCKLYQSKSRYNMENNYLPSADSSTRKELSWTTRSRSASVGSASTTSKDFALPQVTILPERKRVTRSPFRKKSQEYSVELPNERRRGRKGEPNFISSSSEIVSVRSDSSKRQDDRVSRESSISPRNRGASRPPWLLGNRDASFNRKYGNITRNSTRVARPMSARGSSALSPKLAVSNRERSKEPSLASVSRNLVSPERKATNFIAPRKKELIEMSTERREGSLAMSSRQRRDKLKSVGNGAAKSNEKGLRTSKTLGDSFEERISANRTVMSTPDNASFLSSRARTQVYQTRSSRTAASADAPASVTVSQTAATKESRLTNRCSSGARKKPSFRGNKTPERRCEPSAVQDQRENSARLNRGCGRRLRSAEKNPSKGAPLSPKIELSAEVLSLADDTDKSVIPNDERLTEHTFPIDPQEMNAKATMSDKTRAIASAENAEAAKNEAISDNTDNVARSEVPEIVRNLRTRAASANNLLRSCKSASASHPARRDANFEARSGLNGAKLNTRSNDAVDKMRCDESAKASSAPRGSGNKETKAHERDIDGNSRDEELKLPRRDSKIGLVMNSALKRYIKMLKQGLLDHGDKDSVALASLSLTDAISILSEQKTPLSPEEIQELQNVLIQVERNPELIHKESLSNVDNIVLK